LQSHPQTTRNTVLFQRISVVFCDLILAAALTLNLNYQKKIHNGDLISPSIVFLNPSLLIVDHIHFQYNGALIGILMIAVAVVSVYKTKVTTAACASSAALFAALFNLKHLYLTIAPVIFVFLLAKCMESKKNTSTVRGKIWTKFNSCRFLCIASATAFVFAVSVIPFHRDLPQIFARLFPFKRGLVHAYWAPNFWSLYIATDRFLKKGASAKKSDSLIFFLCFHLISIMKLFLVVPSYAIDHTGTATRGLIGDSDVLSILPEISPRESLVLSLIFMIVPLWRTWKNPDTINLVLGIVLCSFSAFIFGWHVHEKAILTCFLPLQYVCNVLQFFFLTAYLTMFIQINFTQEFLLDFEFM
jgi:alpha-1,3-glucosyltransferase